MIVQTELERIKQDFLKQGPGVGRWESRSDDYAAAQNGTHGGTRTQLRFDAEVVGDTSFEDSMDTVFDLFKEDLEDLIQNGDMGQYNDAFLHALDGAKKRGVQPDDVLVPGAQMFPEYKPIKDTTEYTLYIVLIVKWPT